MRNTLKLAAMALTLAAVGGYNAHADDVQRVIALNNNNNKIRTFSIVNQNISVTVPVGNRRIMNSTMFKINGGRNETAYYRVRVTERDQYARKGTPDSPLCEAVVTTTYHDVGNRVSCGGSTQVGVCSFQARTTSAPHRCDFTVDAR